jgi:hypothetical protein
VQSIPAELARDVKGMQEPETPLGWLGLDLQLRLQRDLLETYFSAEPPAPPHVVLAKGGADGQQVQARLGIGEDTLRPKTPALRPNPRGPSRVFRPAAPPNPPNAPCCRTPPPSLVHISCAGLVHGDSLERHPHPRRAAHAALLVSTHPYPSPYRSLLS